MKFDRDQFEHRPWWFPLRFYALAFGRGYRLGLRVGRDSSQTFTPVDDVPHPPLSAPSAHSVEEDVTGVPVAQLRAMIRLLWPAEITPTAKRQLEALCAQAGSPAYLGAGECDLHEVCRDGERQCPYHQALAAGPYPSSAIRPEGT